MKHVNMSVCVCVRERAFFPFISVHIFISVDSTVQDVRFDRFVRPKLAFHSTAQWMEILKSISLSLCLVWWLAWDARSRRRIDERSRISLKFSARLNKVCMHDRTRMNQVNYWVQNYIPLTNEAINISEVYSISIWRSHSFVHSSRFAVSLDFIHDQ